MIVRITLWLWSIIWIIIWITIIIILCIAVYKIYQIDKFNKNRTINTNISDYEREKISSKYEIERISSEYIKYNDIKIKIDRKLDYEIEEMKKYINKIEKFNMVYKYSDFIKIINKLNYVQISYNIKNEINVMKNIHLNTMNKQDKMTIFEKAISLKYLTIEMAKINDMFLKKLAFLYDKHTETIYNDDNWEFIKMNQINLFSLKNIIEKWY